MFGIFRIVYCSVIWLSFIFNKLKRYLFKNDGIEFCYRIFWVKFGLYI